MKNENDEDEGIDMSGMGEGEETPDLRKVCQVCGEKSTCYSIYRHDKPDRSIITEVELFDLCEVCGKKFFDGFQVAIPDIVEGR